MTAIVAHPRCADVQSIHVLARSGQLAQDGVSQRLMAGSCRTYQAGECIFREGDDAAHVYKVELGCLCIHRSMLDGRRQIIDFAYPGDFIGLAVLKEHSTNAETLNLVRLRSYSKARLHQSAQNDAQLGLRLFELVSRELSAAQRMLFTLNKRSACERVANFLVDLSKRMERNGGDPFLLVLPMTRADIGDLLGLTIETVSRTMSKFRQCGLISLTQCAIVTIVDIEALGKIANGAFK